MPTVLLVRHAQGSFGTADYDVLSETGTEQVAMLAGDLRRRGARIDRVVSGSLARQRDTAGPVAEAMGCEVALDARWNEYDAADVLEHHAAVAARLERAEGEEAPAMSSRDFQRVLDEALLGWVTAGGDGPAGEPWPAFAARVRGALTDLAAGLGSGETALVSTSGGVIGALCAGLLGLPDTALVTFNRVTINAAVSKVVVGRGGTTLVSFNEHQHLERPGGALVTYR